MIVALESKEEIKQYEESPFVFKNAYYLDWEKVNTTLLEANDPKTKRGAKFKLEFYNDEAFIDLTTAAYKIKKEEWENKNKEKSQKKDNKKEAE